MLCQKAESASSLVDVPVLAGDPINKVALNTELRYKVHFAPAIEIDRTAAGKRRCGPRPERTCSCPF
jgi:hypothetical protein